MIRAGSMFRSTTFLDFGAIAHPTAVRATKKRGAPKGRAIERRLLDLLQASNYVRVRSLDRDLGAAIRCLQRAGMVLYAPVSQVWVPGERTLEWIIEKRFVRPIVAIKASA